jgi:hypothetical protein
MDALSAESIKSLQSKLGQKFRLNRVRHTEILEHTRQMATTGNARGGKSDAVRGQKRFPHSFCR